MFNIFKGLRLYGINTLPGIGRPAGPGPIPADDWYADYVDNLLANQHNPTTATGGEWTPNSAPTMGWSCCETDTTGVTALAELILAPTAFVAPSNLTLAPLAAANPVGTNHTVTATATTAAGAAAPGVTVTFTVLSGPNAGPVVCSETGGTTNTTDGNGQAKCTYHDNGGAGTDNIQASIGALLSNVVTKNWGGSVPIVITDIPTVVRMGLVHHGGTAGTREHVDAVPSPEGSHRLKPRARSFCSPRGGPSGRPFFDASWPSMVAAVSDRRRMAAS
jgi:hypothetical protein